MRARLSTPAAVAFMCLFTSQAALLVLSPILPELAHDLGVSTAAAGQLRTLSGATGGLAAVLIALAPRRPGLRAMLTAAVSLVAAGAVLSAAAPSYAVLAAAQAVLGAGVGVLVAVGIAAAGEWSAPEERPHTLAWAIAGMPMAWVVGMPLVGLAASVHWRVAWIAVPAAAALVTAAMLRLRPADPAVRRSGELAAAAWRRPEIARFTAGELAANAAFASMLTYSGALLIESYGSSRATVTLGLAAMATVMVPGTFLGRRRAVHATPALLAMLTLVQAVAVAALGVERPGPGLSLSVMAAMAFLNGWRTMVASGLGMDSAPDDKVGVMSMRGAANQFGYLLGAAVGGAAIAFGGFSLYGPVLAGLFVLGALPQVMRSSAAPPAARRGGQRRGGSSTARSRARAPRRGAARVHAALVQRETPEIRVEASNSGRWS